MYLLLFLRIKYIFLYIIKIIILICVGFIHQAHIRSENQNIIFFLKYFKYNVYLRFLQLWYVTFFKNKNSPRKHATIITGSIHIQLNLWFYFLTTPLQLHERLSTKTNSITRNVIHNIYMCVHVFRSNLNFNGASDISGSQMIDID